MPSYKFKITLQLNHPIPEPRPSYAEWFTLLANIYGVSSKSFDGYVSSVDYSDMSLVIHCYLVEDNDNKEKFIPLKERYSDWNGYQKISIIDSVKLHSQLLGYRVSTIGIVSV